MLLRLNLPLQGVRLSLLATGAALGMLSCGGGDLTAPQTPTTGSLAITTATSGPQTDADGYAVTIDGGAETAVGANATLRRDNLAPGDHTVQLTGIALSCSVAGENPRTVTVTAGQTTTVAFQLTCGGSTGQLQITTTTSGASPDPNGYTITLDGSDHGSIGVSGTVTLDQLAAGSHLAGLSDVADNCRVEGDNPRTVEVSPASTVTLAFSITCSAAASSLIAFDSKDGTNVDIFVVNPDGTGLTNLTKGSAAAEVAPAWSPDGRKIAFTDTHDIYVMNRDGTGRAKLTDLPLAKTASASVVGWSPEGSRIAFVTICCEGTDQLGQIWIMQADGSRLSALTEGVSASWSPDGTRLAVGDPTVRGIVLVQADGTGETPLVRNGFEPAWSPDGARIAFANSGGTGIETIHPDGTGRMALTSGPSLDVTPVWSPDGSKIAFDAIYGDAGYSEVTVMNSDGSGRTGLGRGANASWAPDGRRVAFVGFEGFVGPAAQEDVYVINTDGTGLINLSNNPATTDQGPAWSP